MAAPHGVLDKHPTGCSQAPQRVHSSTPTEGVSNRRFEERVERSHEVESRYRRIGNGTVSLRFLNTQRQHQHQPLRP